MEVWLDGIMGLELPSSKKGLWGGSRQESKNKKRMRTEQEKSNEVRGAEKRKAIAVKESSDLSRAEVLSP